jgi:hypothetical protein
MPEEAFGSGRLIVVLILLILVVIPYWKIFGKAGFSSWLALLILVPIVNLVMLYFLAFADWPVLKERRTE